jgi:8-oxo-dGTP diphosphatase
MRLLVVRHGHAEPKHAWTGPDGDRPLVARGRRQAKSLARDLARYGPTRIVSSPSVRCGQTVEPLARLCRLIVELSDALAPDAGDRATDLIRDLVRTSLETDVVVACTHREVIVSVLPGLLKEFGVKPGHRLPGGKGSTWTLDFRRSKLVGVEYRPTPP